MRTVYPYTEHHENPISHPSIASAVSRDRAARTSTTGPNCEKKLRTTPTNRERTHHTSFVSHVTSSPPTRESANPRIRDHPSVRAIAPPPAIAPARIHAYLHPPCDRVHRRISSTPRRRRWWNPPCARRRRRPRSSPAHAIRARSSVRATTAIDDVYGAMIHRVGVILDVSCALLP